MHNTEAILKMYQDIAAEHRIPFFNYAHPALSQDKNLFYNSQHLNKNGAARFSQLFAEDLKRIAD